MSYAVRFDLNGKPKCLTVSLDDEQAAIETAKAIYPDGKGFKAEPYVRGLAKSIPLQAPPPQVLEAEKPKPIAPPAPPAPVVEPKPAAE